MILTNCAACAAPLAHNAPRCVRCHTRYCNKTCQHDHCENVLRFPVGTRVECRVDGFDGWQEGRVVGHWYREASMPPGHFMSYQIKLDRGVLIFARRDDDKMIRRAIG